MVRQIPVSLHLGAHKTASTHLQHSLAQNAELLAENGVKYLGPKFLRAKDHHLFDLFGMRASGQILGDVSGAEQVRRLVKPSNRLVLSEENILGPVFSEGNPNMLYPIAALRVEKFVNTVAPCPVTLFISVREPAGWLASLYSQRVVGGDLRSFEGFLEGNSAQHLCWSELVERLARIQGIAGLFVWRKEDYPAVAAPVLRRMLGWRIGPLVKRIETRVNTALSAEAIDLIQEWGRQGRDGDAKTWVKELRKQNDLTDPANAFDPWSEAVKSASLAAYEADVEKIAAMDSVHLLKPSPRSRAKQRI